MGVVDSSFLISLFIPADKHHKEAAGLFEAEDRFLAPEDIIKETLTVVARRLSIQSLA